MICPFQNLQMSQNKIIHLIIVQNGIQDRLKMKTGQYSTASDPVALAAQNLGVFGLATSRLHSSFCCQQQVTQR
jgi:hypothetical protein